jgi:dipeptidyl aminopeptidase/acylaminoacyl peptidase
MKKIATLIALGLAAAVAALGGCGTPATKVANDIPGADPLIPFEALLLKSSYEAPKLSPDGKHIAVLGQVDGVGNLMLATIDRPTELKPLTKDTGRGFQATTIWDEPTFRWAPSGKHLFYIRDDKGDENWVLYSLDIATGTSRQLTPGEGVRVRGLQTSPKFPDEVLFSMNDKGPRALDYYRANAVTGKVAHVVTAGPPYLAMVFDDEFQPRLGVKLDKKDRSLVVDTRRGGKWVQTNRIASEDTAALSSNHINDTGGAVITADGKTLIGFSSQGTDTTALVSYDLATGKRATLALDPQVDIKRALVHPQTGKPQAYMRNFTVAEWKVLDEGLRKDFEKLQAMDFGEIEIQSRTPDDSKWIVRFMRPDYPVRYHLYDRAGGQLTQLGLSTPQLANLKLSNMHPIVIKSSDGFDLVSYVSYPTWVKLDANKVPETPQPVITFVHGGPSDERAQYAFAPLLQWLTNRGYAVFLVNFRGSLGFGKKFINADKLEWGGAMHRDVLEQVDNLVKLRIADPKRLGIFGGSYGGYETLVAMTLTPGVFACGNAVVGPSNLETFIVGYGKDSPEGDASSWYPRLGDPRTPEGLKLLKERSPLNYAHQTKGSMLIVQGANDIRVPTGESEQVVQAMQKAGVKVTYLLYPDEGHGLIRTENNRTFLAASEVFFGECLGGRYEALTAAQVEGSSVQVPVGAEHLPGMQAALAARKDDGMLQVDKSIDSAHFGDYVGQYDLKGYKLAVTLEGKALFMDIPGQGKHEMLPFEKDGFFMRAGPVKLRFKRGADGKVSEVGIETSDGAPNTAQRIAS